MEELVGAMTGAVRRRTSHDRTGDRASARARRSGAERSTTTGRLARLARLQALQIIIVLAVIVVIFAALKPAAS